MKKILLQLFFIFIFINSIYSQRTSSCNCWQQRDTTWSVVPFDGSGGNGGPGLPPDYRNDDWSTDSIPIPFIFCFYGDTVRHIYINNNGNVSIGSPYDDYTANSFPDTAFSMIAPFWSDVDTEDPLSGLVYYKIYPNYLVVQWDHVGYYDANADLTNTYQLILSDGFAHVLPENKNVGFCYHEMEWTTGDADDGIGGFPDLASPPIVPATVGVNYGDGIHYLQIGLYADSTNNYDGPYGSNDGIKSLINQSFAFNVCVSSFNVAPILSGNYICDTIDLCVGDTFSYSANFLSPEQGQITTVTSNNHGMSGVNLITNPGNPASVSVSFVAAAAGIYNIDIIGTDNGSPSANATIPLVFNIQNCAAGITDVNANKDLIYPNPVLNELYLSLIETGNNITIADAAGRIIFKGDVEQKVTLNTGEWSQGIYSITVSSQERIFHQKIIKQ